MIILQREGLIKSTIKIEGKDYIIWSVYNSADLKKINEDLEKVIESDTNKRLIIGGDFNIRSGNMGGRLNETRFGTDFIRSSKDKTISNEGKELIYNVQNKG